MTWPDPPEGLSIVIPTFNERDNIDDLLRELRSVQSRLERPLEVVLVDDGSDDGTWGLLSEVCARDPRFKALQLSRNFGQQSALTAGLDVASDPTCRRCVCSLYLERRR